MQVGTESYLLGLRVWAPIMAGDPLFHVYVICAIRRIYVHTYIICDVLVTKLYFAVMFSQESPSMRQVWSRRFLPLPLPLFYFSLRCRAHAQKIKKN